jgi:hypothetical protein
MRPHRVQKSVCRRVVAAALGDHAAEALLRETGIASLPEMLPAGPRDLAALADELRPFVELYRAVEARAGREVALGIARAAIVESGRVTHAHDAGAGHHRGAVPEEPAADGSGAAAETPLPLTSPPPPGFTAAAVELHRRFELAMRYFSCEGRLLEYSPEAVHFHVTACNWVRAMLLAGAPELIPFFCETDERFMDDHPTHRLVRPTAIGLGQTVCDFRFVRRTGSPEPQEEG